MSEPERLRPSSQNPKPTPRLPIMASSVSYQNQKAPLAGQQTSQQATQPQQQHQQQLRGDDQMDINNPTQPPRIGAERAVLDVVSGVDALKVRDEVALASRARRSQEASEGPDLIAEMEASLARKRKQRSPSPAAKKPSRRSAKKTKNETSGASKPPAKSKAEDENAEAKGAEAKGAEFVMGEADVEIEAEEKGTDYPFQLIFNPKSSMRCAIKVDDHEPIGNPFRDMPLWSINLRLDGGRYGRPGVGLNFKMSKSAEEKSGDQKYHTWTADWQPGVKVAGDWMIEKFRYQAAMRPDNPTWMKNTCPSAIAKLRGNYDLQKAQQKLVCMHFTSNALKHSDYNSMWPLVLGETGEEPVYNSLMELFCMDAKHSITVWFLVQDAAVEYFFGKCLRFFAHAVEKRLPPLHQYLNKDGSPVFDFDMKTIYTFGGGMYLRNIVEEFHDGKKVITHKGEKPSFYSMPRVVDWDSIELFHISQGVSIIRELQYNSGIVAPLQDEWHHIYLERAPALIGNHGIPVTPDPSGFKTSFFAGVRIRCPEGSDIREYIPAENSAVILKFGNVKDSWVQEAKEYSWFGRVESRSKAWHEATGTHFCVFVTKPNRSPYKWSVKGAPQLLPDDILHRAMIEIKVDTMTPEKELTGIDKFCNPQYIPEVLDEIRLALWSEPSRVPPLELRDLTAGPKVKSKSAEIVEANHAKWDALVKEITSKTPDNAKQLEILQTAAKMASRIIAVSGPPGVGKTKSLKDLTISLLEVGHKVLITAPTNAAIDADATAIYNGLSKEQKTRIRCLRLETGSAEKAAVMARHNYADYEDIDVSVAPEFFDPKTAQEHPAVRQALEKATVEYAAHDSKMQTFVKQYHSVDKAYKAMQKSSRIKRSTCPNGATLDFRIWELTHEDRKQAEIKFQAMEVKMSPEQYEAKKSSGELTVGMFDESKKYRDCIADYFRKDGEISGEERIIMEYEVDTMFSRVLQNTEILFTTCSNTGGTRLSGQHHFQPSIIMCDEAGQVTIPALAVPLTTFTDWEALYLFGDIKQLEPIALSSKFNEFAQNAKISPFSLLLQKGFPAIELDLQYRMCPAATVFLSDQWYEGKLRDHPSALLDNDIRRAMRKVSKDSYGRKGPNADGSEYFFVDVKYGVSRLEQDSTSLVNHANADAVINLIGKILQEKIIDPRKIKILAYYKGQMRLLNRKIKESEWEKLVKNGVQVHTVDAFQGREDDVIIVDLVAARNILKPKQGQEQQDIDEADDLEDDGSEAILKAGVATSFVRNPNRLCVALSRCRHGLVVVGQRSLLMRTNKKHKTKHWNALSNLIVNAERRGLVATETTYDTHPLAKAARDNLNDAQYKRLLERADNAEFNFMERARRAYFPPRVVKDSPVKAPFYRSHRGVTTRPIQQNTLAAKADAHDKGQRDAETAKQSHLESHGHQIAELTASKAKQQKVGDEIETAKAPQQDSSAATSSIGTTIAPAAQDATRTDVSLLDDAYLESSGRNPEDLEEEGENVGLPRSKGEQGNDKAPHDFDLIFD